MLDAPANLDQPAPGSRHLLRRPPSDARELPHLLTPGFLDRIRQYGQLDSNGCLNCGACTIVCDLSTDASPFPRRLIQYASFGLETKLRSALEPWLCHDCRDCSALCPRDAAPGESMATIRRYLAGQYDVTGLTSRIFRSRTWEIGVLVFTALLVFALAWGYHLWEVGLTNADLVSMPMGLEHMFPTITWFTRVVFLLPLLFLGIGAFRMHRFTMRGRRIPARLYAAELKTLVADTLLQRRMRDCPGARQKQRWLGHFLLALSFALISVILFFFLGWFQTDRIVPIYSPQRWIGYFITAVMIFVPAQILVSRFRKRKAAHEFSEGEDVALPLLVLLTAVSGIAVHLFRYLELPMTCHFTYAVHLAIAVPLVVIEVPFGKLSHVIYRPLALYFRAVREREVLTATAPSTAPTPLQPTEARS